MASKQIPDEVKAGMEFLDKKIPRWREKVDVEHLQMGNCYMCILGQLFGEYSEGLVRLELFDDEGDNLGFDKWDSDEVTYQELTAIWREALDSESEH